MRVLLAMLAGLALHVAGAATTAGALFQEAHELAPSAPEPTLADLFFAEVRVPADNPRSLAHPDLAGKVTLLAVLSVDSPQCVALARLLAELHHRHSERGLAILGLAFDSTGDFVRDSERVTEFARRHALEFPFFVCGRADVEIATQALGWIEPVRSFPTFRLAGPDRRFLSSLTSLDERQLRVELEKRITAMLAAPADDGAETWSRLVATGWTIRANRWRMFPGDSASFSEREGVRRLEIGPDGGMGGSGVELHGECLSGLGMWRFDPEAGVLLSPLKFGTRMFPAGGSSTPMLARRGHADEAGRLRALADPDPVVRREALFALGESRRRKGSAVEAVALLEDPVLEVRVAAAWALGEAREQRALEALEKLSDHPHLPLRCAALSALGKTYERTEDLLRFSDLIETDRDPLGQWALLSEMLD
jgi:hypothetical protein